MSTATAAASMVTPWRLIVSSTPTNLLRLVPELLPVHMPKKTLYISTKRTKVQLHIVCPGIEASPWPARWWGRPEQRCHHQLNKGEVVVVL